MPPGGRGESSNSPMDFTEIKALHSGLGLGGGALKHHICRRTWSSPPYGCLSPGGWGLWEEGRVGGN